MAQNDPVTVDAVDELITALNTISGIEFVEDAWLQKAPDNYGVVELIGEAGNDYADGKKTAQSYAVRITIYVTGGSHAWIQSVQDVLDSRGLWYTMPMRGYLQDINKVTWEWNTRLRRPLIRTTGA